MKIQNLMIAALLAFSFIGCVNKEPKPALTQLESDKQELYALNNAYREGEIESYAYIKKARVLNAKIYGQEENLDSKNNVN